MTRTLPLVFLLILFASGCGEAEHPREELIGSYRPAPVQVNIPDPNLRKAVERALGKAQGAPITDEEMATLADLSAVNSNIGDLTGLNFASSLTTLELDSNQIVDIALLASLTQLTELSLNSNQIPDITPLAGLIQLRGLGLYHNQSLVDTSLLCVLLEINPALELSTDVVVRCQD